MRRLITAAAATLVLATPTLAQDTVSGQAAKPATAASSPASTANIVEIEGTVVKVVPKKKEIYVKDAAGKKHEFYFKPHTKLMSAGAPAEFSALKEGLNVKVSAEKHGKRLDPLTVEIR